MGLFGIIQIDIIGPYHVSFTGKETRGNRPLKVWVLVVLDLLTSGVNMIMMKDYSTKGLIMALSNHFTAYNQAKIVTSDSGTQLTKLNKENVLEENIIEGSSKYFKGSKFFSCPPESQWYNGQVESNIKLVKNMVRSYFSRIKKQCLPKIDIFEMLLLLNSISNTLNDRPICSQSVDGESFTLSVNDLIKPLFPDQIFTSLSNLSESARSCLDTLHKVIEEELILGRLYNKTSNKVITSSNSLLPNDFVFIPSPTQNYHNSKYGIIVGSLTDHQYKVKIIARRLKDGSGKCKEVVIPIQRLVLLHRPHTTDQ